MKEDSMLTNDGLVEELPNRIGGVQRVYRWGDWGLSLINSPMAHTFPFAWEAAVMRWRGKNYSLDYSTELTNDAVVFQSDDEANAFIERARSLFTKEAP